MHICTRTLAKPRCEDNDNNGLWTAIVVAAECFRLRVALAEQDQAAAAAAKAAMRQFFGGLVMLNTVTDIEGLMARSLVGPGESISDHGKVWRNSSNIPGFQWKTDTSSDEVAGRFSRVLRRVVLQTACQSVSFAQQAMRQSGQCCRSDRCLLAPPPSQATCLPTTSSRASALTTPCRPRQNGC